MLILERMATEKMKKNDNFFKCKICDFITSKKTNYDLHVQTQKHIRNTLSTNGNTKNEKMFKCDNCGKNYKDRTGLWRHSKKCNMDDIKICGEEPTDKELIMMLIKENSELKTMMMKVIEKGTNNYTNN